MNPLAERLKRARKSVGLSLRKAGELAQLSHTAIQKFEDEGSYPSSDILLRLAKAYNVRMEYFFRPESPQLGEVKFRKRKKLPQKRLNAIVHLILDQIERRLEIENLLPNKLVQPFMVPRKILSEVSDLNQIEEISEIVRKEWNLGLSSITNLVDLLEEHGVRVLMIDVEDKEFDGLAGTVGSNIPIIVVGKSWPGDRQRFTLAHELGHLILNGRLNSQIDEEKAANRFAGAFLIPQDVLIQEIGQLRTSIEMRELLMIKEEYGISMLAICFRLHDLQVISESYLLRLIKLFNFKGWNKKEPGKSCPSEKVHVFYLLILHALSEGVIGESKSAELLNMSIDQFRKYRNLCYEQAACE
jgi:Zn-dependent peptidase ImmA (M78 family)/transcriptional regulator with XRE-family HTH domain